MATECQFFLCQYPATCPHRTCMHLHPYSSSFPTIPLIPLTFLTVSVTCCHLLVIRVIWFIVKCQSVLGQGVFLLSLGLSRHSYLPPGSFSTKTGPEEWILLNKLGFYKNVYFSVNTPGFKAFFALQWHTTCQGSPPSLPLLGSSRRVWWCSSQPPRWSWLMPRREHDFPARGPVSLAEWNTINGWWSNTMALGLTLN